MKKFSTWLFLAVTISLLLNQGHHPVLGNNTHSGCVSPPSGLVGWWPGDGNAKDIQVDNNGTRMNGAHFGPGLVGPAFRFDGVDDFIDVPDSLLLDSITRAITVDAWINPQFAETGGGWIFARRDPFMSEGFAIAVGNGGDIGVTVATFATFATSTTVTDFLSDPGLIALGQWQHIAATADTTTGQVLAYLNGNPVPLKAGLEPSTISGQLVNVNHLFIGQRQSSDTDEGVVGGSHYKGLVDEVEVFNRALSAAEIQGIFNAGTRGKCRQSFDK